jgi:chromosome segregation ATPase
VIEEQELDNTIMITNLNPKDLIDFAQNKALSAAARTQLEQIARTKQSITDTDAALRRTGTEIDNLFRDQERLRQNISNLNQVSGQQEQVQKYARSLAAQESQLATLRDRQNELTQKKASLESELNAMIEKVEF